MATLFVAEIDKLGLDARGHDVMAPKFPCLRESVVSIGMSHAESAAFTGATLFVQISCDATCSIAFGVAPAATTTDQRLVANEKIFVAVEPGHKVSVIANS